MKSILSWPLMEEDWGWNHMGSTAGMGKTYEVQNISLTSKECAELYVTGHITNVRHDSSNMNFYAEIRSKHGDLLLSDTLDCCVERMKESAEYLASI